MYMKFRAMLLFGFIGYLIVNTAVYTYAKQKQPGYKKVRGQSEATMVISDQKL